MGLDRLRITSVGGAIGVGYTTMYFGGMTLGNLGAVATLFNAIKAFFPTTITYTIPASGDTIDEATGKLTGGWSMGSVQTVLGTGLVSASPAGFLVQWKTPTVIDAHRPEGKLIIVPAAAGAFNNTSGNISSSCISTVNTAAAAFLSSTAGFATWHRPVYNSKVDPPVLVRAGGSVLVTSGTVAAMATVLRSRRR